MRRRGIEMRLVVGGGADPKIDSAILKAVARANQWLTELLSGRASSLVEIGRREGVGKRYVSRIVRLAFLALRSSNKLLMATSHLSLPPKRSRPAAAISL